MTKNIKIQEDESESKNASIGDVFRYFGTTLYIIACVGCNHVTLVNLDTGNRFNKTVHIENRYCITLDELEHLGINDNFKKFKGRIIIDVT